MDINIDSVLRARLGKKYRFLPSFLIKWLEKTIRQKELNHLLQVNRGKTGGEFCKGVIETLNVSCRFHGVENLPDENNSKLIFASNHPLGGLDGMILINFLSQRYPSKKIKFVVNDLLSAVEPLNDVFLPVNKHGSQSRQNSNLIEEAFCSDSPVIVFPAGLVSRKQSLFGKIRDLSWHKMFIKKSLRHNRPIIPVYFCGENSSFFYNFAHLRALSGLKFNIEMIYLPAEVIDSQNKTFDVYFGEPVSPNSLSNLSHEQAAQKIKQLVYDLAPIN